MNVLRIKNGVLNMAMLITLEILAEDIKSYMLEMSAFQLVKIICIAECLLLLNALGISTLQHSALYCGRL